MKEAQGRTEAVVKEQVRASHLVAPVPEWINGRLDTAAYKSVPPEVQNTAETASNLVHTVVIEGANQRLRFTEDQVSNNKNWRCSGRTQRQSSRKW